MTDRASTTRESLRRSSQIPSSTRTTSTARRSLLPSKKKFVVLSVIGLLILVLAGWRILHHPANLNDVTVVKAKISKHYVLPTNETPALATVTDSKKVQSAFAGKVQNGDKILIYQKNKIAVVYRPGLDRIVDVEPVSIDTPPSAQASN